MYQRQQCVGSVWQETVLDHGTPSSCLKRAAIETKAEIFSLSGVCISQVHKEQVCPGLCPQPEDVAIPPACWSIAWDLVVAGTIQHIGTTVGRV